ncbi:MAG: hypothetical protein JNK78_11910, partial [Planctomycetes bacterium]|nr:hypothetical protein [Planctomycetota bacterium]
SATNELFEVGFGGMITIPAAFVFLGASGTIAAVQTGTFGLGFKTLPVVFAQMPAGTIIGGFWFFMLFLAAITSSLSMLQPTLAFFEEALGVTRKKATTLLVVISLLGSLFVLYYSKGLTALSVLDDWVGTLGIFVLAMVQIICFGWVFGIDRGWKEMHEGAQIRLWSGFKFVIRYLTPLFLVVVFVAFCINNLGGWIDAVAQDGVKQMSVGVIGATILLLVVITRIGEKRWRAMGLDLDGRLPPPDEKQADGKGGAR